MFCNGCGSANPDDASFCSSCGREVHRTVVAPTRVDRLPDPRVVKLTVVAQDAGHEMWSAGEVEGAREWLLKHEGRIPSIQDLYNAFGQESVEPDVGGFFAIDKNI